MFSNRAQRIVITGFVLVVGLLVAAGGIGIWGLRAIELQLTDSLKVHYQHSRLADEMQDASVQRLLVLQEMLTTTDAFARNDLMARLQVQAERFMNARAQLMGLPLEPWERELLAAQAAAANRSAPLVQRIAELLVQEQDAEARELLLEELIPAQGALIATLQQIIAAEARQIDQDTRSARRQSQRAVIELVALAAIGIVLAGAIAWLTHRQVSQILSTLRGLVGRLRRSTRRERAIRRTMLDGLITADSGGRILTANRAVEELLGYRPGELLGRNLCILMSGDQAHHHDGYMRHYLAGGAARIIGKGREVEAVRKDGRRIPIELGVVHLHQDGEDLFVGFLHDISDRKKNERLLKEAKANLAAEVMMRTAELETANRRLAQEVAERKQAQELLARQATHDPLTGLPNRRLFHDRLAQAVASARRHQEGLALMYLDLDGFKQVNDRLGHDAGDELLQAIASRLLKNVRKEDVLARLGGDEFALLLSHAGDRAQLTAIADKLLSAVAEPVSLGADSATVGASIGIARFTAGLDAATLLRHADQAMYQAKRAGRGRYQLYRSLQSAQSVG